VLKGGVTTIVGFFLLHETYAPVLLERKTAKLRRETGNPHLRAEFSRPSPQYLLLLFLRPIKLLVFSPIILLLSLHIAITYSYIYLLLTTVPTVFEDRYGFSQSIVGLVFLGLFFGMMVGLVICLIGIPKYIAAKRAAGAAYTSETLLPMMIPGAFIIPVSLFWYGWSVECNAPYIVPIIGTGFFGASFLSTFVGTSYSQEHNASLTQSFEVPMQVYLVDVFQIYAASATAASVILRSLVGAFLPLAGSPMFQALGLGWGSSILGFISLAMLPVPFIFVSYGEMLRKKYPVKL
jgi:hypothetical protein